MTVPPPSNPRARVPNQPDTHVCGSDKGYVLPGQRGYLAALKRDAASGDERAVEELARYRRRTRRR